MGSSWADFSLFASVGRRFATPQTCFFHLCHETPPGICPFHGVVVAVAAVAVSDVVLFVLVVVLNVACFSCLLILPLCGRLHS